jgi:hypothetical protein
VEFLQNLGGHLVFPLRRIDRFFIWLRQIKRLKPLLQALLITPCSLLIP